MPQAHEEPVASVKLLVFLGGSHRALVCYSRSSVGCFLEQRRDRITHFQTRWAAANSSPQPYARRRTAAATGMLPWYQQARVLRKLTVTATGLTAFVCVLHADYGEKPHAFSWLQSYYRAEVVEPLRRQYARLTKKDE